MKDWKSLAPRAKEPTPEEAKKRREDMHQLERAIKDAIAEGRAALWKLAALLDKWDEEVGWSALGYASQNEWLGDPEIGITRGHFHDLVDTYRELNRRAVEPTAIRVLEYTKVRRVLPAVRQGRVNLDDALDDAKALSKSDLIEKYRDPASQSARADQEPDSPAPPQNPTNDTLTRASHGEPIPATGNDGEPIAATGVTPPFDEAAGEQVAPDVEGTARKAEPVSRLCPTCAQAIPPRLPARIGRVREARERAGMTAAQVADALGVSHAIVRRWETHAREPGVHAAVRLARVLGTTADALWAPDNESGAAPQQRPTP